MTTADLVADIDPAVDVDLVRGQSIGVESAVAAAQFGYDGRDLTRRVDAGEVILMTGSGSVRLQAVSITATSGAGAA